jgi:predicted ATP-grasp superfamily ATP-dependent carboligase
MVAVATEIAAWSGCLGTIGVDFVLGKGPMAIEVNPRFQGTLDTVEAATGINLFQAHLDACAGSLPGTPVRAGQYAAREILFAPRDMRVDSSLAPLAPAVADIPRKGTSVEEGHALVSVLGRGPTRATACAMLENHKRRVLQYIG